MFIMYVQYVHHMKKAGSKTSSSLVPRPKEEEEEGPCFSHLHVHLIVVEFHLIRIHVLLIYFIHL